MLKKGRSGGIYIHPWDITEEGIDNCFDYLDEVCGLNELFVAAVYHANTFLLSHNPKRIVRWDDGSVFFAPEHPRWRDTRIRPILGDCVDTPGFLHNIMDSARGRDWGVLFFVVFHFSHSTAQAYPDVCCVDAMGERQRAYLCPSNPSVRAYDLAIVEELMGTYGGDGIRHESLGFGLWNDGFLVDKVEVPPSPRDQYLLNLCFCGSCLHRARDEGFDPLPLKREIRRHLYESLAEPPSERDMGPADEEWARNVFAGGLWSYLEVRCNTVTSLFSDVQEIVTRYDGAFMPFGIRNERSVMGCLDSSKLYPHFKRVSLGGSGDTIQARENSLVEQISKVPEWAEPEMMHNQRAFNSMEELRDEVMMVRRAGIRHHSFHYYGMTPRYQLEWIGQARAAWA